MTKKRCIISFAVLAVIWLSLSVMMLVLPKKDYSSAERRKLASFPKVSTDTLLSGSFMSDFESYILDNFPLRDGFRTIKAVTVYDLLACRDNNGIFVSEGQAAQTIYPTNESSVNNFASKLSDIYNTYIDGTDCKAYAAAVPDKGYYLASRNGFLSPDYDLIFDGMKNAVPQAEYIDITDTLSAESYYASDTHWRQEKLLPTAEKLLSTMNAPIGEFRQTVVKRDFKGVYAGQAALPMVGESIILCENDTTEAAQLYNVETDETTPVYTMDKLGGRDAYDVFLTGASPMLTVTNPLCESGRELVIFRDSFASSLTPLLLEGYSRVTLVDTRYIPSAMIGDYVDFSDQDVLFIYSAILINSSFSLR